MISQAMIDRMDATPKHPTAVTSGADLARLSCKTLRHHEALGIGQIMAQVGELPGWEYENGRICLRKTFENYGKTRQFVGQVADLADAEDHHPDIEFGYNRCTVWLNTHDVGGISAKDFIVAAKINRLT